MWIVGNHLVNFVIRDTLTKVPLDCYCNFVPKKVAVSESKQEWLLSTSVTVFCTTWDNCWPVLRVPRPPHKTKPHISEWPFIVASLRHTCVIIVLSNQHLDIILRIISAKTCPVLQIKTDLWTIFQKNDFFVFVENVSDLWARLRTIRSKKKVLPLYLDLVYVYLLAFFTFWEALKWL